MNLSAILVVTHPSRLDECISVLGNMVGISVHHFDPAAGKIIVTQEAESVDAEVEGLKRIKTLSEVLMAEMIYHYFEDDDVLQTQMPAELDNFQGLGELPEFLKKSAE
jgi:nitrate reductase NapD